jgi:hypothetical protein
MDGTAFYVMSLGHFTKRDMFDGTVSEYDGRVHFLGLISI